MGITAEQRNMVIVLLLGAVMVVLNQTLLSPTLPVIMADLGIEATTVQWLTSGYSLMEAIVIPLSAFFIGKFSTRQLFIGGMSLFAVGTLCCFFSPNFIVLLAGRMIQAAAAGVVMAMVFTVIMLTFPIEKRGAAMGIVGLVISFAPAVGPSVGGLLADSIGWRALFVVVTAMVVLIIVGAIFFLRNREGFEQASFDMISVIMSTIGLGCLLFGISTVSSSDNLVITLACILVGIVFVGLFVHRQNTLEVPLLRIEVLKTRRYRTAVILVFVFQCALIGLGVIMPIYIQNVLGYSATVSGLCMLPGAAIGAICGVLSGRLFDKYGIRGLALFGAVCMVIGAFLMTLFDASTPVILVATIYSVLIIGLQFLMTPINTWGVNSLDNRIIQHANAVTNTINQVGASLGTALLTTLSAYGYLIAPNATGAELTMAGDHISFCGVFVITLIVLVVVIFAVKDKATDVDPHKVHVAEMGGTYVTDRTWLVRDVMATTYISIMADATIGQAASKLSKYNTSGLVVVDHLGKPVGFLSDGDIMNGIARHESTFHDGINFMVLVDSRKMQDKVAKLLEENVMSFATKKVVSIDADYALEDAAKVLSEKRIKKLPVLENGRLVGMISRRDIISAMVHVNHLDVEED